MTLYPLPSMPGIWLGLQLLPTMDLPKQWHHHCHGNPVVLPQGTKTWCLGHNSESSSSHSRVLIPEFPFQKQHVPLALCPGEPPLLCPVATKVTAGGAVSSVPLKPDSVWSWSFTFSCALSDFRFGSLPFQQQKRQEDSPWLTESAADNTLHLKFLLIFCLDTL